jgi:hypothetical protein
MQAGDSPAEMVVGCGTLNVRYGESIGLFDHLSEILGVDLSAVPEIPGLFQVPDEPGQSRETRTRSQNVEQQSFFTCV